MKVIKLCLNLLFTVLNIISMTCFAAPGDVSDADPEILHQASLMITKSVQTIKDCPNVMVNNQPSILLPTNKQNIFAVLSFGAEKQAAEKQIINFTQGFLFDEKDLECATQCFDTKVWYSSFNILVESDEIKLYVKSIQCDCGVRYPGDHYFEKVFENHKTVCSDCKAGAAPRPDLGHAKASLNSLTKNVTVFLLDSSEEISNFYEIGTTASRTIEVTDKKSAFIRLTSGALTSILEARQKASQAGMKEQMVKNAVASIETSSNKIDKSQIELMSQMVATMMLQLEGDRNKQITQLQLDCDKSQRECHQLKTDHQSLLQEHKKLQIAHADLKGEYAVHCTNCIAANQNLPQNTDTLAVDFKVQQNAQGGLDASILKVEMLSREMRVAQDSIATLTKQLNEVQQCSDKAFAQSTQQKISMNELKLRMDVLDSKTTSGICNWKIPGVKQRFEDAQSGKTLSLYSPPFFTSSDGYRMCIRAYLNGDGSGKGTHISLFFTLMKSEYDSVLTWPFQFFVSLSLLNQDDITNSITATFEPDKKSKSFQKPINEMNVASGFPKLAPHAVFKDSQFVKEDAIYFRCYVHVPNMSIGSGSESPLKDKTYEKTLADRTQHQEKKSK